MNPTNVIPSSFQLIKRTLSLYRTNLKLFLLIGLIGVVFTTAINLFFNTGFEYITGFSFENLEDPENIPLLLENLLETVLFGIILSFSSVFVTFITWFAVTKVSRDVSENIVTTPNEAYVWTIKKIFPLLWISILFYSVLIGSSVFLVIPAIVLFIFLSFPYSVYMNENVSGLNALSASFYYVRNNWWSVFRKTIYGTFMFTVVPVIFVIPLRFLSLYFMTKSPDWAILFFSIAGMILQILSASILIPLLSIFFYQIYKVHKETKPAYTVDMGSKTRPWFIGLGIFSVLLSILIMLTVFMFTVVPFVTGFTKALIETPQEEYSLWSKSPSIQLIEYSDGTTYEDTAYGFSMSLPKYWKGTESEDGSSIEVRYPNTKESDAYGFISTRTFGLLGVDMSPQEKASSVADDIILVDRNDEVFDFVEYIGPNHTIYAIYITSPNIGNGPAMKNLYAFVVNENIVHTLNIRAYEKDWSNIEKDVLNILSSFQSTYYDTQSPK